MDDSIVKIQSAVDALYIIGAQTVEKVNWFGDTSITRTYWDGEKLVSERISPEDFYAPITPPDTLNPLD